MDMYASSFHLLKKESGMNFLRCICYLLHCCRGVESPTSDVTENFVVVQQRVADFDQELVEISRVNPFRAALTSVNDVPVATTSPAIPRNYSNALTLVSALTTPPRVVSLSDMGTETAREEIDSPAQSITIDSDMEFEEIFSGPFRRIPSCNNVDRSRSISQRSE